jgi:formylmethanofuran dehydrogenase subunit B
VAERRESIVCPGCGCLCDDLDLTFDQDRLLEVANVCLWGAGRFLATKKLHPKKDRRRILEPQVRVKGRLKQVSYEAALAQAGEILTRARRPVIYGLTSLGSWAQEAALRLARGLKARLEPADVALMAPYYQSLKEHGFYGAPLDVIRDEADTVLFWGANPLHSCPRHLVRYAVFARGRFTERGVEDRRVAAVDLYPTELAKFCQLFVQIHPGQELALIREVSARLRGRPKSGPSVPGARKLADFLAQASYGAIFFGRGVGYGPGGELLAHLARLVAWLNHKTPFRLLPLLGDFNAGGLYHLLLRELGSAGAPDFNSPKVVTHTTPVDFREADALLVAGADLFWLLTDDQAQDLKSRRVPLVTLTPFANRTTRHSQVIFPVALAGVEAEEIAYRMDGLPVSLKKLVPSSWPPDHEVLADLGRVT